MIAFLVIAAMSTAHAGKPNVAPPWDSYCGVNGGRAGAAIPPLASPGFIVR